MTTSDDDPIERRLERIKGAAAPRRKGPGPWLIGTIAATGGLLLGGTIVARAPARVEAPAPVATATPAEFGGEGGLDQFSIARPDKRLPDLPQAPDEIARLTRLVGDLRAEITTLKAAPPPAPDAKALADLKRRNGELEQAAAAAQAELDAERARAAGDAVTAEAAAAKAADEQRQREVEAARTEAQITSEMVAFRGSSAGGKDAGAIGGPSGGGDAFLRESAAPVAVREAEIVANPSHTITQGTLIEATLESAIDSDLPGPVSAVVSQDVWSWDMSRILIPRGSKLFGKYESDVGVGERRILIAWTRILTTDGQSVDIAAYGADRLGRSGLPAKVKTHFLEKFGSATLLSIIGAAPDYAAAQGEKDASADAIKAVGGGLETASDEAMGAYLSIPPTLSTDQGAVVTVRVDSDLEFF